MCVGGCWLFPLFSRASEIYVMETKSKERLATAQQCFCKTQVTSSGQARLCRSQSKDYPVRHWNGNSALRENQQRNVECEVGLWEPPQSNHVHFRGDKQKQVNTNRKGHAQSSTLGAQNCTGSRTQLLKHCRHLQVGRTCTGRTSGLLWEKYRARVWAHYLPQNKSLKDWLQNFSREAWEMCFMTHIILNIACWPQFALLHCLIQKNLIKPCSFFLSKKSSR